MLFLVVAAVVAALLAAAALPLLILWACAETREGDPPRRLLFDFALLREWGLVRTLRIGGSRLPLLTYRRDARGRFRKLL